MRLDPLVINTVGMATCKGPFILRHAYPAILSTLSLYINLFLQKTISPTLLNLFE